MAFKEDLAPFFSDFEISASYTPQVGDPATISAIFDKGYQAGSDGGEVEIEGIKPTLTVKDADIPNIQHGDSFTISSKNYTVVGIEADGTGITELILEEL